MHIQRIRRIVTSLGLTIPITTTAGCGDPCLDDGQGQVGAYCLDLPDQEGASGSDGGSDPSSEPEDEPPEDEPPEDDPPDDDPPDDVPPDGGDETGAAEPELEVQLLRDADEDGYGDPEDMVMADPADAPAGYVPASVGADCDDDDPETHPGAAQYEDLFMCTTDQDDDGWGDEVPAPGVTAGLDCDDASATTFPGSAEFELPTACTNDDDGDGWGDRDVPPWVDAGGDCADGDAALFGCHTLWCMDADADGFGDPADCAAGGDMPPSEAHVPNDDDCDDGRAMVHPGKAFAEPELCTMDADGDGYGPLVPTPGADAGSDCHDGSPFAFPGASENELPPLDAWCTRDADGDGYGDVHAWAGIKPGTDCNDSSAGTHVGAAEIEDEAACMADEDNDGYGAVFPVPGVVPGLDCADDDPTVTICNRWCIDQDGDGWGDAALCSVWAADPGLPWVQNSLDCFDGDAQAFPGAAAAEPMLCTIDADGDGFGDRHALGTVDKGHDCDDASAAVFLGAAAHEPGLCTRDMDGDGYGDAQAPDGVERGLDCDDASAATFPGAAPNDDPEGCMADQDGDDYGALLPPAGVSPGSDCDDADPVLADCQCLAPIHYLACDGSWNEPTSDALQAIGLGCSADPVTSMVLASSSFAVTDDATWAVLDRFGDAVDPDHPAIGLWSRRPYVGDPDAHDNAGNNVLLLSTGPLSSPGADGVLMEASGSQLGANETGNPDGNAFPAPILAQVGSLGGTGGRPFEACDGVGDCSDTLAALGLEELGLHDQVSFEVELVVPANVDGFRFDVAVFSSEYPDWVDLPFSDVFVVWVEGAAFTGNVAVTPTGAPLTVTGLAYAGQMAIEGDDPRLSGTGFEGHGATGWRSLVAPAVPGETLRVAFLLADVADADRATAVLLDNFRWDCAGCEGIDDCGLTTLP